MISPLQEIIAQLPKLSGEELDQLASRIKALRSLHGEVAKAVAWDEVEDLDMILHCATEVAQSLGADMSSSFQLRQAAKHSAGFRDKLPPLLRYLRQACPTRAQQHALLCLGFRLLHRDMTRMGIVVTARTFLAHVHRLPAVIEHSFPGYARAGLLHGWVVK